MNRIIEAHKTFVPKFGGNDKLPVEDQVKVTYPPISAKLRATLMPRPEYRAKIDSFGNSDGGEAIIKMDDHALLRGLRFKIHNYTYRLSDSEDEQKIENAEDLISAPTEASDELIEELATHFRKELRKEKNEKN